VSPRRGQPALTASPVLVGAVTILVTIVAVFLSYNANSGLPFVPTYDLKANLPNAAQLVKGFEVRIGGARVGFLSKIEPKRLPESVALTDGALSCLNHETVSSVWHCPKCDKFFCPTCTRGVNLVGRPVHKLCPLCSGPVELAPWAENKGRKRSIWTRVKRALSRTMRVR